MNLTADQAPRCHLKRARKPIGAGRQELSPAEECQWVCSVAGSQRFAIQSIERGRK
jgi:hypothetical protein